jgi:ubiquitin C-terminal hydrolase
MKYILKKYYIGGNNQISLGLPNYGNYCFFSASIQLLYHMEQFRDFLITHKSIYRINSSADDLISIFENIKNKYIDKNTDNINALYNAFIGSPYHRSKSNKTNKIFDYISTFAIKEQYDTKNEISRLSIIQNIKDDLCNKQYIDTNLCENKEFKKLQNLDELGEYILINNIDTKKITMAQQDASELLIFLLNKVIDINELSKSINIDDIIKSFQVIENKYIIKDEELKKKTIDEINKDLVDEINNPNQIELKSTNDIMFIVPIEDNKYKLSKLLENNIKNFQIREDGSKIKQEYLFNKYIIFTMNIFGFDQTKSEPYEITYEQLNLIDKELTINNKTYIFIGCICHSGSFHGGHYIFYNYIGKENGIDMYYCYDDSHVTKTDGNKNRFNCYVLLYKQKEHFSISDDKPIIKQDTVIDLICKYIESSK